MDIRYIEEPSLQFGLNQHICPRAGIRDYSPFDISQVRPEKIVTGMVGKSESIDKICAWIDICRKEIAAKTVRKGKKQNLNLFPSFPGFNAEGAFRSSIQYDDTYLRKINNSDFETIHNKDLSLDQIIKEVAGLYLNEIKYLAKNKSPNVILVVLHEGLMKHILKASYSPETDEELIAEKEDEEDISEKEKNFRRYIKAKAMQFKIPIQIVRDRIGTPTGEMQDAATIAWNFFTALYYKASGTPWALIRKDMS
ncbi:MAG: hypothetical protein JST13_08565, partial [Bacteroidetes bacterium]|nr:hypothetical protein [Bacteroidota bacterium]